MRLRIYKRKVLLLLALGAAACALALWGGGGGGGSKRDPEPPRRAAPTNSSAAAAAAASSWWGSRAGPASPPAPAGNASAVQRLRALAYRLNFDQAALGAADPAGGAGGSSREWELAVVVQVHERAEHLRLLLESLGRAAGAEKVLLVLSHDLWSEELNALAAAAARDGPCAGVLQIFFPFSAQLYPAEFPGPDPRDCPRDLGQAAARRRGCLNAAYPDSFGHYREARFAQTKHHWWWKLHFVWERLRALRGHAGPVLFLEEDHYLAPDFYHVLRRLRELQQRDCPDCQLLSLGGYGPVRGSLAGRADKVELKTWKSTEHNMGMAFGRETYQQLMACADAFCTYDDYNWDWTLQHLTVACLPKVWKVLVPEIPRVFHTGDCGMHHRQSCRPAAQSAKIDSLLDSNRQHLFPEAMAISKRYNVAPLSPHVKNGGWGDIRDHELCKSYRRLQ